MGEVFGISYFVDSTQRIYWCYLLTAMFIAWLFCRKRPTLWRQQFSKSVLWHPSARLDYLYYVMVSAVKLLVVIPLLIHVNDITLWIVLRFQELFGYMPRIRVDKSWPIAGYTVSLFILNDFTRYWLHRWMHTVPLLWRFHRIHHSAEVLNPLTFYRVHPVENLLFGLRYALTTGLVTALFIYFFGAGIGVVEVLGVNIFVLFFLLIGANLRHSHIPLRYPARVERWILSPYQHQLHHSKHNTRKNYGSALALWDRWFHTLKSAKREDLCFGLPNEVSTHSLTGALFHPFTKGVTL